MSNKRKVKFQGVLGDDGGDEQASACLNSLIDRSWSSKEKGESVFSESTSNHSDEKDDKSGDWTVSSFGQSRRLYGRSREKVALRQAYRSIWEADAGSQPTVQLALISGLAGSGKTSLAMSLKQHVLEDGGFFLTGKFDKMQTSQLYDAIVSAFTQLVENVVEKGVEAVRAMKQAIQAAVHTEQRILTDMIPALTKILGPSRKDSPKEFRQSSDEVSSFKFVFRMFIRAISSPEFPIVLLLDDLHYADDASLDLLQSLVTDSANDGILFVGTFRIEKKNDRIKRFLKQIESVDLTDIRLAGLPRESIDEMVADMFSVVHPEQIKPLTDIFYKRTSGNVFYVRQFLRYLQEEKLLSFDEAGMEWVWDERKILDKLTFRKSIELMTIRLSKLPKGTREVLEVAACLGSQLDEKLLNRISPRPVFSHLQKATSMGFLQYDKESDRYWFSHDIIQEAAYKMVLYQEREAFHLTIGRELWKSFDDIEELEDHIFIILGQIREGANLINYQEEKNDVAALCLRAGELAICVSCFQTASEYLLLGVSMLGENCWNEEYDLTLELYNTAAEVEYCVGNFDNVEKLASEIFAKTRHFPDTLRAHSIHVYSLGSRGHMLKAIERGLNVLEKLGERFPTKQSPNSVAVAMKRTKWLIKGRPNEELLRLPLMNNPAKLAAMQMMNIMFLYAYIAVPSLAPLISLRMVKLTLEYGLCDVSSIGFVTYAMLLCGIGSDFDEGYRFGDLAMKIFDKFDTKAWIGRIAAWFYGSVCTWRKPILMIFDPIKKAHRVALESGDIDFAMLNANIYCWESFDISTLPKVEKIISGFSSRMDAYGQESVLMMIKPLWQTVHNLTGRAHGDPRVLTGQIMEQDYMVQYARENNKTLLIWCHFYRLLLAYLFGDMESAEVHASVCRVAENNPFGSSDHVLLMFYDALVTMGQGKMSRQQQKNATRCVKIFKSWSKQSPENFLGKLYFLEAELAAANGDSDRAHSKYTSAISLSREGGFILQHALANERAGKYFLRRGEKELAHSYLKEAVAVYQKWGGKAKVDHLRNEVFRSGVALTHSSSRA
ncbi:serine/threonine kinase [Nitzschia inconspicua]|uniref:Serine/threonine kinase n=1 Tax=Nitzschia inconspicua TaxID=303405 RepID=A0A9K3PJ14_9STRA|nr:serine/threonine kinase [Nitzschia inconspicua]